MNLTVLVVNGSVYAFVLCYSALEERNCKLREQRIRQNVFVAFCIFFDFFAQFSELGLNKVGQVCK